MKKRFILFIIFLFFVSIVTLNAATASGSGNTCNTTIGKTGTYASVGSVYTEKVSRSNNNCYYTDATSMPKKSGYTCTKTLGPFNGATCKSGGETIFSGSIKECARYCRLEGGKCIGNKTSYYTYKCCKNSSEVKKTKIQLISVEGNQYNLNGNTESPAFCIQPGKRYSSGIPYAENDTFDLSKCENTQGDYRCGLAYILMQSLNSDGQYNEEKYTYGETLTALRLWTAYKSNLSGTDGFGSEDVDEGNDLIAAANFYSITAQKAVTDSAYASSGTVCKEGVTQEGLICSGANGYIKALSLFKDVLSGKTLDFSAFAGDPYYTTPTTVYSTDINQVNITIPIFLTCDEVKAAGYDESYCVAPEYVLYDEAGNIVQEGSLECEKQNCHFVLKESLTDCTETTTSIVKEYKLKIMVPKASGTIKQYVPCNSDDYQIMMAIEILKDEDEQEKKWQEVSGSIVIKCVKQCNTAKTCPNKDMIIKTDSPSSCGNTYDTYYEGYKKDPYMNCILNACDQGLKDYFDKSEKYGVNTEVCRIYCREDVTFYMADKTKVYSGMQFRYEIEIPLEGKIKPVNTDNSLTSVVLQKRQCTSEIYYDKKQPNGGDSWLEQYDKAVKAMNEAYNNWKSAEALYDWQMVDNGGNPDKEIIPGVQCYVGTGCDGTCKESKYLNPIEFMYFWPNEGTREKYNKFTVTSASDPKGIKFKISTGKDYNDLPSGDYNHASGCGSKCCLYNECCSGGTSEEDPCKGCCEKNEFYTTGTCMAGHTGDENAAKIEENNTFIVYKSTVDVVAQLIYDLQNCNLYVDSAENRVRFEDGIKYVYNDIYRIVTKYHGIYTPNIIKAKGSSTKDFILTESSCKNEKDCVSLEITYADKNYGAKTEFGKETSLINNDINKNYYCKNGNDSAPDCYKYEELNEVEKNVGIYNSNVTLDHDIITCSGTRTNAKCDTKPMNLPTNDYATFITVTETDFWQPKSYSTEVYTGLVSEDNSTSSNTIPLGKNVYPVSNDKTSGMTGTYNISYKFKNIGEYVFTKLAEYDYSCVYEVYNKTVSYDCDPEDKECKGSYTVTDNVPKINYTDWDKVTDTKGYGFVYRNVDLANLFPNGNRAINTNWSNMSALIEEIKDSANTIYTDSKYLEYSYTLTPDAIKKIREYNKGKNSGAGGYLDNSLIDCEGDSVNGFSNCKSTFLNEFKDSNNSFGIIVNYAGGK